MLFFDKGNLKQRLEDATVRDHTNMRKWHERQERRYDRIMNEPILHRFCTICFICMMISSIGPAVLDIYAHMTYLSSYGALHMVQNAVTSAFWGWLFFAVPLIPSVLVQLHRGFSDPYYDRYKMNRRGTPRMPLTKRFRLYLLIAVIGLIVLFIAYLVIRATM